MFCIIQSCNIDLEHCRGFDRILWNEETARMIKCFANPNWNDDQIRICRDSKQRKLSTNDNFSHRPWESKHVTSGYLVPIFKWITATQLYPKDQTNQFTTLSATQTKYTWMWCNFSHSLTFHRTWGTSALPRYLGAPSIQIYRLILNLIPNRVYPPRQGNPKL